MTPSDATTPLGRTAATRSRCGARLGLTAICLGFLMITLDATIVNVALGPIVADLGGDLAGAQWVVSGYTIAFASLLLSAGALADRLGVRAGFVIGLGLFAVGSALCAGAFSLPMLIASRALQGVGAAWLMPCSLALIGHTFTATHERRRALAIWGGVSGIGLAAGPVLGGVLTSVIGWQAIFLVNIPVAAAAGALIRLHIPETRRHRHHVDLPGQLLAVASLSMLTGAFIVAGRSGWTGVLALVLLGAGALALLAFAAVQRGSTRPMVDPLLLRAPELRLAVAIGLIFNFCLYGSLFCLAIDLEGAFSLGSLDTGLAMLPVTVVTGATAYLSGRAVNRFGEWQVILSGLAAGVIAATLVALAPLCGGALAVVGASAPLGLTALAMPAMTAVAIGSAPRHRIGLASGVLNAARQTGGALGVAVLGMLLGHSGHEISLPPAFAVVAGLYAVGCVLARRGRANEPVEAVSR